MFTERSACANQTSDPCETLAPRSHTPSRGNAYSTFEGRNRPESKPQRDSYTALHNTSPTFCPSFLRERKTPSKRNGSAFTERPVCTNETSDPCETLAPRSHTPPRGQRVFPFRGQKQTRKQTIMGSSYTALQDNSPTFRASFQ